MSSLHLHDGRIITVHYRSAQNRFAGKVTLIQNIHRNLHHTVSACGIDKCRIQFARKHLLHPIAFAGNGVCADKAHALLPFPAHGGCIGTGSHTVVLSIDHINFRKAGEQSIHSLFRPRTQPSPVFLCQQTDVRASGYDAHKSFMAVYGRSRTRQSRNFHHRTFPMKHIGHIPAYRLAYFVIVRTNISGVLFGKDSAVYHNNGNTPVVGFFYNRGYGFGFIGSDYQ